jgi:hypothetical protein
MCTIKVPQGVTQGQFLFFSGQYLTPMGCMIDIWIKTGVQRQVQGNALRDVGLQTLKCIAHVSTKQNPSLSVRIE